MSSLDKPRAAEPAVDRWAVWQRSDTFEVPAPVSEGVETYRGGAFRQTVQRFMRERAAVAAVCALLLLTAAALAAPLLATHDPNAADFSAPLAGRSADHWLGTDQLGRDTFSRLLFAGRVSLLAAVQALGVALMIGVPLGLLAGYFRGKIDSIISAVADGIMALPALLLAVAIIGATGAGLTNAMIAVGVLFAPRFIRLIRATVISIRENAYIAAAVTAGTPPTRIMLRHVLPNALPPLLVQAAFTTGFAMLAEASLSFLGLGVQAPQASWGSMLNDGYANANRSSFLAIPPGVAIALTVLLFNVFGDGLRAAIGREERR